jgi:uncharacterized membrane protein
MVMDDQKTLNEEVAQEQGPVQSTPPPFVGGEQQNPNEEKNIGMAIVAYFLFFVPLLAGDKTQFVRYHVNQALVLVLFAIAVNVIGTLVPFIGWFIILPIGGIMAFVLWLMGIINASKGEMKPLPLIGGFEIIK